MARLKRAVAEIEGAGRGVAAPRIIPGSSPGLSPGTGTGGSERDYSSARRLPLARAFDPALGGGLAGDGLHEIVPAAPADGAAAMGFALALAARFLDAQPSAALLVGESFASLEAGALYGPGLIAHGLPLGRLVFVSAPDANMVLWAMEEALKSGASAVVVGEIWNLKGYSLAASRRLLVAALKGGTPALVVPASAYGQADRLSSAAETRFEIAAASSARIAAVAGKDLPGPFACSARLVKTRLGGGDVVDAVADRVSAGRAQRARLQGALVDVVDDRVGLVGAVADRAQAALHSPSEDGRPSGRPIARRKTGVLPDALWERGYNVRMYDPSRVVRLEWRSEERTFDEPAISLSLAAAPGDGPRTAAEQN
jgi:protein ImuA